MMDESELAQRALALPEQYSRRLQPQDLADIREYAEVGEWAEELELLLAALRQTGQPVSAAERDELRDLLTATGMPTDPVAQLNVRA